MGTGRGSTMMPPTMGPGGAGRPQPGTGTDLSSISGGPEGNGAPPILPGGGRQFGMEPPMTMPPAMQPPTMMGPPATQPPAGKVGSGAPPILPMPPQPQTMPAGLPPTDPKLGGMGAQVSGKPSGASPAASAEEQMMKRAGVKKPMQPAPVSRVPAKPMA